MIFFKKANCYCFLFLSVRNLFCLVFFLNFVRKILVFKEVRQLIDERERHLLAELSRIHDDDAHLLKERQHTANNLVRRIERLNAMSDREQQDLLDEIKRYLQSSCFIGKQFSERQRFNCDKKAISKIIKNFGESSFFSC